MSLSRDQLRRRLLGPEAPHDFLEVLNAGPEEAERMERENAEVAGARTPVQQAAREFRRRLLAGRRRAQDTILTAREEGLRSALSPWTLEQRRRERLALELPEIRFCSSYVQPRGATTEVEGWVELPDGLHLPLSVTTPTHLRQLAHSDWQAGSIAAASLLPTAVVVPHDTISPALLEDALMRWYSSLAERAASSFLASNGHLPRFVIDVAWSEQEFPAPAFLPDNEADRRARRARFEASGRDASEAERFPWHSG